MFTKNEINNDCFVYSNIIEKDKLSKESMPGKRLWIRKLSELHNIPDNVTSLSFEHEL